MSDPTNNDDLKNRTYLSLIVRLTLDQRGRFVQGELLDTTDTLRQRFNTLSSLNEAVTSWLSQQEQIDDKNLDLKPPLIYKKRKEDLP